MSKEEDKKTVKARMHHGSDSLDLTIPADFARGHDINPGDVFEVTPSEKEDNFKLIYTKVYSSE